MPPRPWPGRIWRKCASARAGRRPDRLRSRQAVPAAPSERGRRETHKLRKAALLSLVAAAQARAKPPQASTVCAPPAAFGSTRRLPPRREQRSGRRTPRAYGSSSIFRIEPSCPRPCPHDQLRIGRPSRKIDEALKSIKVLKTKVLKANQGRAPSLPCPRAPPRAARTCQGTAA